MFKFDNACEIPLAEHKSIPDMLLRTGRLSPFELSVSAKKAFINIFLKIFPLKANRGMFSIDVKYSALVKNFV